MSRPYSKSRGRGGARGNFGGPGNNGGALGGRGRWAGPGGNRGSHNYNNNNNNHHHHNGGGGGGNNNSNNNNKNKKMGGGGSVATVMTTMLDLLFQKSADTIFNQSNGMLNLSNFHNCADLASVQESVDFNSVAFCKSLAEVIKNKIGSSLRILRLDDDKIQKFAIILNALEEADVHHGVTAISATGNNISDMQFLGTLRRYGSLGELLLKNNPITDRSDYRGQIAKTLTKLLMLDSEMLEHALLWLPNPIPARLDGTQVNVLMFLEHGLFSAIATRNYDSLMNLYHPSAIFSVSRGEDPIPRRIPFDNTHQSTSLSKPQRSIMQGDFAILRAHIPWRNLHDVQSLRHISLGRAKVSLTNKCVGGGEKKQMHLSMELNSNANVMFLSSGMKMPTCVLTLHGKAAWHWIPKNPNGDDIYSTATAPFLACHFDRTITLLLDPATNTWALHNDMLHMRPDRIVLQPDGSPSSPLFFANTPYRVEMLRRRFLPNASLEIMKIIMDSLGSDADVQTFATQRIPQAEAAQILSSPDAVRALLAGG